MCFWLNIACVNIGILKQRKIFLSYAFNISQFEGDIKCLCCWYRSRSNYKLYRMYSLFIDQQCYIFGRHSLKAVLGCLPLHINSFTQSWLLTTSKEKAYENIVGKRENTDNQYFHLFPQCFLPKSRTNYVISAIFILYALNLDMSLSCFN